ncbi:MAG: MogA/MoaB family molybdenum cofactor biosynthesis protein [Desulfurococcaceae archaeon]
MSTEKAENCVRIIVVSDRIREGLDVDTSGEFALEKLREKGLSVCGKTIIGNNYRDIVKTMRESRERILLFIGGTGVSPRDITVDVVENTAWRCLPGFGELFRYISYQQIGIRAILSRSTLCVLHDGKIVVVLPGSPGAVSIGVEILSQIVDHLVEEVDRFESPHRQP